MLRMRCRIGAFFRSWRLLFRLPEIRHEALDGFENTDIVPFGGELHRVEAHGAMHPVATYIPSFPIYPPEFSWMRESRTDISVMLAGTHASGGRIFYFAGDVDRCYGRTHLPDLGRLLANAVKWASAGRIPLRDDGPGYLDCKIYQQPNRWIVHVVNLSGCNQYPGYVEEFLPVGPIRVSIHTGERHDLKAQLRVSGKRADISVHDGWAAVTLDSIADHELIVLE